MWQLQDWGEAAQGVWGFAVVGVTSLNCTNNRQRSK
jgi:hypothetical protein